MQNKVRFTEHALTRLTKRGATKEEVIEAIEFGSREIVKNDRIMCRLNFSYNKIWMDTSYPIKQVAPVIVEENDEIIVITIYTFYF